MSIFNVYIQFRALYTCFYESFFLTSETKFYASFPIKITISESIKQFLQKQDRNSLHKILGNLDVIARNCFDISVQQKKSCQNS